jgi:hypothetical protein
MIETPLRFFEVNEEFFLPDSAKFCHAKLRITPKRFDAINMIFSSRKFILMVVNAVVLIAICYQSIVSLPAVGVNITTFHYSAFKNWHKLCLGTVFDDTQKYPSLSFMQAQNRDFAGRASSAFAANPPGSEIAFINFNIPNKWFGFLNGHINYSVTKQSKNPLNGIAVDRTQIGRRCGRDILAKTLQNPSEFDLRNVRHFYILVFQ